MSRSPDASRSGPVAAPMLAALVAADVAFAYQQTAIVPVIPLIERSLHIGQAWGAWLLSGYLLIATVAAPVLGRLADRHGRRPLLVVGMAVFLAGSLGAAAAPNAVVIIGFRALQGIGGAVYPLSLSVAREELPAARVSAATGLLTGAFGVGTALGFVAAGPLSEAVSWRLVFVTGAVVVAAAIWPVLRWVPRRPGPSGGGLDVRGGALLGACLALLLVALTVAPQQHGAGWALPAGLLVGAAGAGWRWLRHEAGTASPLVDARTLRAPTQRWTNGATLAIGYALFGLYYLVPRFVQDPRPGFGAGTGALGLYLLPIAVGQLVAAPATRRVQGTGTPRRPLTLGLAAMALGAAAMAAGGGATVAGFAAAGFVLGCGAGLSIGASGALASLGADAEHAAVATSLNSTVRRVGGGVGSQVGAAVLILAGTGGPGWRLAFGLNGLCCLAGAAAAARTPVEGSAHRDPSPGERVAAPPAQRRPLPRERR